MATIAEIFIVSDNKIVKWVRRLIKKNSEKTVCLYQRLIFIFCTISLLGGTYFNLFKVYLNDKYKLVITVSFIKEYIFSSIIFGIILLFIILVRVSKSYNKMTNLAFLYGEKNDKTSQGENNKSTIYIYTRIGNQFLYEDKDRLQYNKKEFDDELRKIKEKIKKKKWDKKVRREREKAIDRLKPYSVYIEIEEAKKEFNNLNTCIDTCDDKEKRDNTTSEEKKEGNSNSADNNYKEGNKDDNRNLALEALKDDVKQHVNEIIKKFEEKKPAVKLLPEDELKNYTIYPIIDEERSGFFN